MKFVRLPLSLCAMLALAGVSSMSTYADDKAAEDFFENRVRPLLARRCGECHGASKQESDLRLDSRIDVLVGSDGQDPLVVPGEPDNSRMWQVIQHAEDDTQMPPDDKLAFAEIHILKQWIKAGAYWPDEPEPVTVDDAAWKQHWAFQPVANPDAPVSANDLARILTPVDSFVVARLDERNLTQSPAASPRKLVRRLTVALTGLPPTSEQIARIERDSSSGSVNAFIDELLTSPQFGERWGRYWLDVSRYADTKGYAFTGDRNYKDSYKYRNWVIQSLNDDMPYDEFLRRQIAADRIVDANDAEQLAAMGFFTLGRRFLNNQHDLIDDRIDVLMRGTQALTVTCARCHDHKYDPIPTADYYSLYGVFASSEEPANEPSPLRLVDKANPVTPRIFRRGSAAARGDEVPRQFVAVLSGEDRKPFTDGSGRLELANAIASADNPLTARVIVNRIWGHLFGQGLVETPSDFGVRTGPPSHPLLLDHLASAMMANNWSRKSVIREIVRSATWQQASQPRPDAATVDPENRLLARMNRQRLDFEAHRDALLAAGGEIDLSAVGGESVDITKQPFPRRRTVYAHITRQNLPGVFRNFDFASPDTHSPKRYRTTVPQQALFQLNHPFVLELATAAAEKALRHAEDSGDVSIANALWQQVLQRLPADVELTAATQFLQDARDPSGLAGMPGRWQYGYGQVDEESGMVGSFTPFPAFVDDAWRGGGQLPDPAIGWALLRSDGGHPGDNPAFCVIRRWNVPNAGVVRVRGVLQHKTEEGDGVRGRVVHSATGIITGGAAHNSSQAVFVDQLRVNSGESLDFVVDCRSNTSHDTFIWSPRIIIEFDDPEKTTAAFSSKDEFSGESARQLTPSARLAQALMLSNEFVFVD